MKIFGKKSLSTILYWVFAVSLILSLIVLILNSYQFMFTDFHLSIEYKGTSPIFHELFYGIQKIILFYLLMMIFKSFKSDRMFTSKTAVYLRVFAIFSLCTPIISAVIQYSSIIDVDSYLVGIAKYDILNSMLLSLIIGVFATYISAIFKKGFHLKQENDLTI